MKKYKILFAILLCMVGRVNYAQNVEVDFIMSVDSLNIPNQFNFVIGYSGTTVSGCSNPKIRIEKGILELVTVFGSNYVLEDLSDGVIEISDFVPANLGGSFTDLTVQMKFPNGITCEGATQMVKAILCNKQTTVNVSVKENSIQNRLNLSISQQSPSNTQDICYSNSSIKYRVSAQNNVTTNSYGYYIYDGKITVKLPSRAKMQSLYKMNSYSGVAYNEDIIKGEVSWNLPQEFGSNPTVPIEGYDLYLSFPCNSASNALGSHPSVYISGETRTCETLTYVSDDSIVTNASTFLNQDCSVCEGGGNLLLLDVYKNLPCLACPEEEAYVNYRLNIGPNNTDSTGVFQVRLPKELQTKLKSITRSNSGGIKLYYNNQWNDYTLFTIIPQVNVEKILWVVDMKNPVVDDTRLYFINTEMNDFPIHHSMRVGETDNPFSPFIIEETSTLLATDHCSKQMSLSHYVNNSSVHTSDNFSPTSNLGNVLPGQILTCRMIVYNYGKADLNNLQITNTLNSKLLFNGNLKYGYTDSFQPLTSELSVVPDNGIVENFPINGNKALIEKPYIGETGIINIRSFNSNPFGIPINCLTYKYLVIQFDVKVVDSVNAGEFLQNIARAYSESEYKEMSSGVNIDYRLLTKADILAKCSKESNNDWVSSKDIVENRIQIKAGEKVHYKLYFENTGTIPVELVDMVNTIPDSGDKFETTGVSRESQMSINYTGEIQTGATGFEVIYGTNETIPPPQTSIFGAWITTNMPVANQATWMRIHFDPPKRVNPGEKVEFIYYATVNGDVGQVGNNSFAYNAKQIPERGGYYFVPGQTSLVSVEGSETQCAEPPACENCASFDLLPSETYLISAWVKEENENNPYIQYKNYDKSQIKISFSSKEDKDLPPIEIKIFTPTGNIIDGWQRIIGEFKVPVVADNFNLELENTNTDERITYFDDVRVIPSKGNMKSFVYDQKTQRLMAELDENNYGTYYEYDLEGGLIRIKKETEKGVFTIQETRSSNPKK